MSKGIVFDIKEFALNDGPGIRLTIFMKGCPLRCLWCHNPEGLSPTPQLNNKTNQIVGKEYSTQELVDKIIKFQDVFELSKGGITFSGGEPTLQADFIYETASMLPQIHKTLDTSGYCDSDVFTKLLSVFDLVYFDLKLINEELHQKYTEHSNKKILKNLEILDKSGVPYHIRIPLIPNITDTMENLHEIQQVILNLKNKPQRVDLLPYNILAGGKYDSYNIGYPLKSSPTQNNTDNIERFKKDMILQNINIMEGNIKCSQND